MKSFLKQGLPLMLILAILASVISCADYNEVRANVKKGAKFLNALVPAEESNMIYSGENKRESLLSEITGSITNTADITDTANVETGATNTTGSAITVSGSATTVSGSETPTGSSAAPAGSPEATAESSVTPAGSPETTGESSVIPTGTLATPALSSPVAETASTESPSLEPSATPKGSEKPSNLPSKTSDPNRQKYNSEEVRSVWICFYEYDKYGLKNKNKTEFKKNADKMFKKVRNNGFNTVYFHVRAFDDAIWKSDTFKFSSYMGKKKPKKYDPLTLLIKAAHKYNLSFHAWMNPYRITQKKVLNPAKESTRKRIKKAVKEVITYYDVDGIHFDDYFYPGGGHPQFKKYKKVSGKKRRANVNILIRSIYKMVKKNSKDLQFGISPAGNVEYSASIGGDIKTWLSKKGYIDYIVPQIYWSNSYKMNGKKVKLFNNRFNEFIRLNKIHLPMYIGLALYKGGVGDANDIGWKRTSNNVATQIKKIRKSSKVNGYSIFSYDSLSKKRIQKEVRNMLKAMAEVKLETPKNQIAVGEKIKLLAQAIPYRLSGSIKYKSSNKKIATVSSKGIVKGLSAGKVKITAKKGNTKTKVTLVVGE